MTTTTALPAKYRQARNIRAGYEIQLSERTETPERWATVVNALELLAPVALVSITVEVDGEEIRLAGVRPSDQVYSRRSAS